MQNFVFHNPTKVLFGRGTLDLIGRESAVLGRKVLLVFGKNSLKESGCHERIHHSLLKEGLEVVDFGGVRSNPLLSTVREGIKLVKKEKIDLVVGAGGGSVLDTAKAVAAGAVVEHDVWKFFTGKKSVKTTLPVNTVLTLPAAGSETNSGMVLTNDETREKFGFGHRLLHPVTSILDPELTFSVPADYTAYGAVDAVSHILEFYLTTADHDTPVQKRFMEGLIVNAMDACYRCLEDPNDYNGRANLMWTASLALNGLTSAGLGRVGFPMHLLEHSISGLYDTPHGAGLAATLPGWLSYYADTSPACLAELADHVFPEEALPLKTTRDKAFLFTRSICRWLKTIRVPYSLEQLGIPEHSHADLAQHTTGLAKTWRLREYSPSFMEEMLDRCQRFPVMDAPPCPCSSE